MQEVVKGEVTFGRGWKVRTVPGQEQRCHVLGVGMTGPTRRSCYVPRPPPCLLKPRKSRSRETLGRPFRCSPGARAAKSHRRLGWWQPVDVGTGLKVQLDQDAGPESKRGSLGVGI